MVGIWKNIIEKKIEIFPVKAGTSEQVRNCLASRCCSPACVGKCVIERACISHIQGTIAQYPREMTNSV